MARKLTFLLTDKTAWKLLLKTVFGLLALFIFRQFGFSYLSGAAAVIVFWGIYLSEVQERYALGRSFWVMAFAGLVGGKILASAPLALLLGFTGLWTIGFFTVLGLTAFFFANRQFVYGIFNTPVIFLVLFLFFYISQIGNFWSSGIILFLLIGLIFGEVFRFFEINAPRRTFLFSWGFAVLTLEVAWILSFLPLGFMNAAIFITLVLLVARDTVINHFKGALNLVFLLKELAIFWVLGLLVFAASKWSL
ncbi:MAG: hypothetical protein UY32_C0009G0024 [Candidatus Jorgensenbacteria bacterium GW2011_GWC1_48_8]|uniref:Uncharacterized protein n=2 Tax=Candidatus Joergenseniibacteriota TaxID=1752739 RepID=A0A0G1Z6T8_9BACT|nr:MAG: hypothetical protein UY32_C0009G0024 [Candidatus Jorgensenbacteria bacterium GW2011_GWC1_48_8]KKW14619.1 MAG: hypothetical protein UY55_C0006G0028 [Candidatus Jorgensenbacteria bacterium GW2011_GWB1_50_10]